MYIFFVYLRLCIYYSIYIHAAYISQQPPGMSACSFKEHNTFDAPEFPERPNLAKIFIKGMPKRPLWMPRCGRGMAGLELHCLGVNHPWLRTWKSPWTGRISWGSNIHHSSIDIISTNFKFILNGTHVYIYIYIYHIIYTLCIYIYIYTHCVYIYIYKIIIYIYVYI